MHPPLSAWGWGWGGEGGEPFTNFSKKGGLTGPQFLEGGCWKRGVRVGGWGGGGGGGGGELKFLYKK